MVPNTTYSSRFTTRPEGGGRPEHKQHIQHLPNILDVVAVISNPFRYRSRYDLYRQFERHALESGVRLTTVELAYGERLFEVTSPDNPRHVQFRSSHTLWHKENLINLGIARLPADWRYVAWIDADIQFARHDWAQETMQQLQHHPVVQMWSHAIDLGPKHEPMGPQHQGFAFCYRENIPFAYAPNGSALSYPHTQGPRPANYWHSGFAWAARREAIDTLGGLMDFAVLGAGDWHMAKALLGMALEGMYPGVSSSYLRKVAAWQDRAAALRRNIGYVPGLINHYFHGKKVDRKYWSRWQIIVNNGFDPDKHLVYDAQGVLRLSDDSPIALRDDIASYFTQRNEDSIDV